MLNIQSTLGKAWLAQNASLEIIGL